MAFFVRVLLYCRVVWQVKGSLFNAYKEVNRVSCVPSSVTFLGNSFYFYLVAVTWRDIKHCLQLNISCNLIRRNVFICTVCQWMTNLIFMRRLIWEFSDSLVYRSHSSFIAFFPPLCSDFNIYKYISAVLQSYTAYLHFAGMTILF
jgi:hypothetical protein